LRRVGSFIPFDSPNRFPFSILINKTALTNKGLSVFIPRLHSGLGMTIVNHSFQTGALGVYFNA
jgi:hypothetical protein